MNEALIAETISIAGHGGDEIEAYLARPLGGESFGGVVVIHHMPGYDGGTKEITRTFAAHGYAALMPNLYHRDAPGASPCSGGRQSFLAACSLPLDAAVDCYGAFVVGTPPEGMPLKVRPIVDLAPNLSCPLLGLFGEDDQYPSPDQVAELAKALIEAGKAHEFHSYEGAGHAFFSVNRPAYRVEAANDGWQKIWDFYGRYLAG